jgi:hypothetical protein
MLISDLLILAYITSLAEHICSNLISITCAQLRVVLVVMMMMSGRPSM